MESTSQNSLVAVHAGKAQYSPTPPFDADAQYPEHQFPTGLANPAYEAVRSVLQLLGMDAEHLGTARWNPLGTLIRPGDRVLLKPNLIRESHAVHGDQWEQVITHGSVVRAVLDYVGLALNGRGTVVIGDGPQTDSDFDEIIRRTGLKEVADVWRRRGLDVNITDLRRERWLQRGDITYKRVTLPGDPRGYTTVELGNDSEFANYNLSGRFYGADYDMDDTARYHNAARHAYVLCRTAMEADVIINIPKLKTHKKTGVTLSLKNIVGLNGYRNCLPHHTVGTPAQGGDEFPSSSLRRQIESRSIVAFKRLLAALGGAGGIWARTVKSLGRRVFGETNAVIRSGNRGHR